MTRMSYRTISKASAAIADYLNETLGKIDRLEDSERDENGRICTDYGRALCAAWQRLQTLKIYAMSFQATDEMFTDASKALSEVGLKNDWIDEQIKENETPTWGDKADRLEQMYPHQN